jgi:hypothetical protein
MTRLLCLALRRLELGRQRPLDLMQDSAADKLAAAQLPFPFNSVELRRAGRGGKDKPLGGVII